MAIACLFALLCTMLVPVFISDSTIGFSNSFFSVICFAFLLKLSVEDGKQSCEKRKKKYTNILGFVFSAFTGCGFALREAGSVPYTSVLFVLSVLLYARVFSMLLRMLWAFLEKAEGYLSAEHPQKRSVRVVSGAAGALLSKPILGVALLLLCWLPCYLSIFPGNFVYDATVEYEQIINGYNGNFPMLHTVLITRIMSFLYEWTGSYNAGIAVFVIAQMILLAVLFWHILHTLYKNGINKLLLGAMFAYYAAFPAIHLLVTSSVRDVMFSGLLVYTAFLLYRMFWDKERFFTSVANPILFGVVFALTVLARNNNAGFAALLLIVFVSVVLWVLIRKTSRRGAAILVAASICSYVLVGSVLNAICQPLLPAAKKSALSLLTQPIARAYLLNKDQWTQEETQELGKYFYLDFLSYVDVNADSTKMFFKDETDIAYIEYYKRFQNTMDIDVSLLSSDEEYSLRSFLKLWVKTGIKYPGCYLDAILANTRQMWFPDSVIDGYVKAHEEWGDEKSYFNFTNQIEQPGEFRGIIPAVHEFYNRIGLRMSFEKIPVVSMLFSIGFHFWILLNCCAYLMYRKAKHLYCSAAVILCYAVFSAFAPLVLLRYYAALFFAFPLIVVYTLQPMRSNCQ